VAKFRTQLFDLTSQFDKPILLTVVANEAIGSIVQRDGYLRH
jgi:hypothetical protein